MWDDKRYMIKAYNPMKKEMQGNENVLHINVEKF